MVVHGTKWSFFQKIPDKDRFCYCSIKKFSFLEVYMILRLKLSHSLSFRCPICLRMTLPGVATDIIDPDDDEKKYKICNFCAEKTPSSIRRLKSYQRRWDEKNARSMYSEILRLWEEKDEKN